MGSTAYRHDELDRELVTSRIEAFRHQIERRLAGEITEEQFRPIRRTNGVHLWDHAYILRIPVPRGVLSSHQLRMLAHVARAYDRGYAHFTGQQSIEFHWPALSDIPSVLGDLASAGLYSTGVGSDLVQNSGAPADISYDHSDHASVTIPLDAARDLSDSQMETLADLAETYGLGELRVGGNEIVLPHVAHADLASVHGKLAENGLAANRRSGPAPFTEALHARETQAA
jgi:sulfite reductase beta subunit-like hemoprotein